MIPSRMRIVAQALLALLLAGPAAWADYVTQTVTLDQSNKLADGTPYGSVKVEAYDGVGTKGGGLKKGQVRLTFTADPLALYGPIGLFGFQEIGFNTDLNLKKGQIDGPFAWFESPNEKLDGFGEFDWRLNTLIPQSSVSVLISGLGKKATVDHFLFGSTYDAGTPPQGSVFFAGRIMNLSLGRTGLDLDLHRVGGGGLPPDPGGQNELPQTPEPSTLALSGLALSALGLVRALRRARRATDMESASLLG